MTLLTLSKTRPRTNSIFDFFGWQGYYRLRLQYYLTLQHPQRVPTEGFGFEKRDREGGGVPTTGSPKHEYQHSLFACQEESAVGGYFRLQPKLTADSASLRSRRRDP